MARTRCPCLDRARAATEERHWSCPSPALPTLPLVRAKGREVGRAGEVLHVRTVPSAAEGLHLRARVSQDPSSPLPRAVVPREPLRGHPVRRRGVSSTDGGAPRCCLSGMPLAHRGREPHSHSPLPVTVDAGGIRRLAVGSQNRASFNRQKTSLPRRGRVLVCRIWSGEPVREECLTGPALPPAKTSRSARFSPEDGDEPRSTVRCFAIRAGERSSRALYAPPQGHRSPRLKVIASNGPMLTGSSSIAVAIRTHSPLRSSNASSVRSVGSTSHRWGTPARA